MKLPAFAVKRSSPNGATARRDKLSSLRRIVAQFLLLVAVVAPAMALGHSWSNHWVDWRRRRELAISA